MADKYEIAEWLMNEIRTNGPRRSYQSRLVKAMRDSFGPEWSYKNHNGNQAIDKSVLRHFGTLKDKFVIWDRSDQSWRVVSPEDLERIETRNAERQLRKEEGARIRAAHAAARATRAN
ncbi:hypothetical protein [Cryobacterium sp. HLT2-28]|uniref:DUF6953 family protein n=1 Tax=Cryobacterium sp. HLT2-28 TaxID=1259146 RepID=UPI0010699539|nr:hypothetical protein [Cryobacterium sp. HLT2-28]TFB92787.1 hypothetical protein E3O48_13580 [Cryobacterium sp. HLT2-28]